jgi:LysM repeat protein
MSTDPIEPVGAGQTYAASGWFSSYNYLDTDVALTITEYTAAGVVVNSSSASVTPVPGSNKWKQATVDYTVERNGDYLELSATENTGNSRNDPFLADVFSVILS